KPRTPLLDDKWVFDAPYLIELARLLGLAKVEIHPAQHDLTNVFESAFRSMLADSGHAALPIPGPVHDAVREFDRSIGLELKRHLSPTGIIVLTKRRNLPPLGLARSFPFPSSSRSSRRGRSLSPSTRDSCRSTACSHSIHR